MSGVGGVVIIDGNTDGRCLDSLANWQCVKGRVLKSFNMAFDNAFANILRESKVVPAAQPAYGAEMVGAVRGEGVCKRA